MDMGTTNGARGDFSLILKMRFSPAMRHHRRPTVTSVLSKTQGIDCSTSSRAQVPIPGLLQLQSNFCWLIHATRTKTMNPSRTPLSSTSTTTNRRPTMTHVFSKTPGIDCSTRSRAKGPIPGLLRLVKLDDATMATTRYSKNRTRTTVSWLRPATSTTATTTRSGTLSPTPKTQIRQPCDT